MAPSAVRAKRRNGARQSRTMIGTPGVKAGGTRSGHLEVAVVGPEGVIISTPAPLRSRPNGRVLRTRATAFDRLDPDSRRRRVICGVLSSGPSTRSVSWAGTPGRVGPDPAV